MVPFARARVQMECLAQQIAGLRSLIKIQFLVLRGGKYYWLSYVVSLPWGEGETCRYHRAYFYYKVWAGL